MAFVRENIRTPLSKLQLPDPDRVALRDAPFPWRRWLGKSLLFLAFAAVVLNPNLKRAFLQVGHTLQPEALIQTNFTGLSSINAQIERMLVADGGKRSEPRMIARFVLKKIHYVSDYENWGNLEYWPTAEEAWQKGQEDCDGRAILAASILRARGYHSTALVVGLDHMWIRVNENEKNPGQPARWVALLSPKGDFNLQLRSRSRFADFLCLAKAFLHPTALRDTSTHLFAEVPALRKAILVVALLLCCYHPCRHFTGFLGVTLVGLTATDLLVHWQPDRGSALLGWSGAALLLMAVLAACAMEKFLRRRPLPKELVLEQIPSVAHSTGLGCPTSSAPERA